MMDENCQSQHIDEHLEVLQHSSSKLTGENKTVVREVSYIEV